MLEIKLTKKQRKGLAFRQKKNGKGRPDPQDVPLGENQDDVLDEDTQPVTSSSNTQNRRSTAADAVVDRIEPDDQAAKGAADRVRSREAAEEPPKLKKQKRKAGENGDNDVNIAEDANAEQGAKAKEQQKARYILFVGNLKYTTSKEAILTHFAVCDPPPRVRLLTPKADSTAKSKGCAFLEFSHRNALQQALKLHQSELDSRRINVELTAGGGGKGENRIGKLKERNHGLATQRTKILQKQTDGATEPERPQRYSTTSGIADAPPTKRTWTVPEDGDDGTTHRGGQKHAKRRGEKKKGKGRDWGTGVNAIPVG
ncbi:hypothetical protein EW145_g4151 [Phellinidium pouzarii]|uniref:RRM domain-containing protein n=1 Tax=Phellinidium pouzarii TaxID=167371 RepID=A0A4S4L4K7_9AGAM|nr:hypothetical protein EW145_g4151 [Phellinidium pouzarii]